MSEILDMRNPPQQRCDWCEARCTQLYATMEAKRAGFRRVCENCNGRLISEYGVAIAGVVTRYFD